MKYLLDTHLLLWAISGDRRFPARARELLAESGAEAFFSAASVWEVSIKNGLPRRSLGIPADAFRRECLAAGFHELSVGARHAAAVESLPHRHEDPFDRLLLAQAMEEDCVLLTHDPVLPAYGAPVQHV